MIQNLKIKTGIILSIFLFAAAISAQVPKPVKPQFPKSETPAEKAIAVDAKVNISLCVAKGKINVNGWDRKEVRAYVSSGGSRVGFKVLKKDKNEKAVWIMVVGFDTQETGSLQNEECLSGDDIELDVPRGAIVNIKSRDSETKIESVDKVRFSNVGGNVFFDNIANGIEAETKQGSITVGNSGGLIGLSTTNGNIVVFNANPSEVSDFLKVHTINGTITLQEIEHLLLDVNSFSGSIKFTGEPIAGGQYNFVTQSGAIMLSIPQESSCKVNAFWRSGAFNSLIPMQNIKKTSVSGVQNLTGQIGGGEAMFNLTTSGGRIFIQKADK